MRCNLFCHVSCCRILKSPIFISEYSDAFVSLLITQYVSYFTGKYWHMRNKFWCSAKIMKPANKTNVTIAFVGCFDTFFNS